MRAQRRQRLILLLLALLGIGLAVGLALYALRQNVNLYYTPAQVVSGKVPMQRLFRMGGMVQRGSVHYDKKKLGVRFVLSDGRHHVSVSYRGILPDLFREGQGIVAQGKLDSEGRFVASEVLAKHDEKYMPQAVRDSLAQASESA